MAINFPAVRQAHSLADFCSSRGIELKRSGSARTLVGRCPLHNERTPSFHVYPDEHFNCFGCGAHGDVIALCMKLDGLTVVEAAKKLGSSENYSSQTKIAHDRSEPAIRPTKQNPLALPYQMSLEQMRECGRCAERLITNAQAIQALVDWRGWGPVTIRDLALEPALGLRINGRLALLYSSGLKTRVIGSREFRWSFGKPWIWRGELILEFQNIYICEGETDVIRLINDGLERDGQTLAVGLPSASFNLAPWAFLFAGKAVTLVPDDDEAGAKALDRTVQALEPVAESIAFLDWRLVA
jgi:CHC2-type zinc finger protein